MNSVLLSNLFFRQIACTLTIIILMLLPICGIGQSTNLPPSISYQTPQLYIKDSSITPLPVINVGGAVSTGSYLKVATVAGSTSGFLDNAAPLNAKFDGPGGMTKDGAGNIYIADIWTHRIRKIDAVTGAVSTLAGSGDGYIDGTGVAAKFSYPTGITYDGAGALYIADKGNHRIRKLVISSGVVTTFAGYVPFLGGGGYVDATGTSARFNDPEGIYYALEGAIPVLYVADRGNHRIRKIVIATAVVSTFAGTGAAGNTEGAALTTAKFNNPIQVAADGAGTVYVSDYNNHKIRKIQAGTVSTLAGSGTAGAADGTGSAASFNYPYGLVIDSAGVMYVGDSKNNKIRRIAATGTVTTIAGTGGAATTNGIGTSAAFSEPVGLVIDLKNNLYVSEYIGDVIRKINMSGYKAIGTLPTGLIINDTTGTISGKPTVLSAATNYQVAGYNIYGGDTATINITVAAIPVLSTSTVSSITSSTAVSGGVVTTNNNSEVTERGVCYSIAANPTISDSKAVSSDNTTTFSATLSGLQGLTTYYVRAYATNAAGTAYGNEVSFTTPLDPPAFSYNTTSVQYTLNNVITPLTVNNTGGAVSATLPGLVTTFAGNGTAGNAIGAIADTRFRYPTGIALDKNGNIYVADGFNRWVKKISTNGVVTAISQNIDAVGIVVDDAGVVYVSANNLIYKLVPSGSTYTQSLLAGTNFATGHADGEALSSKFYGARGMAFDKDGNLYVADEFNNVIRKISTTGIVSTYAGTVSVGGYADGPATSAIFRNPRGVTVDKSGNVYVSDAANHRIRKIDTNGQVSTVAGSGSGGLSDGVGTAAAFYTPSGIALDDEGNLYVTDAYLNNTIRKIDVNGKVSTVAGAGSAGYINAVGRDAKFSTPIDVVVTKTGTILVCDKDNHSIRSINQSGFSIYPTLPAGLNMDSTGTISGTPTFPIKKTRFTIIGKNASGSDTAYIDIEVLDRLQAPAISYAVSSQSYKINTAINPLTVTNSGGAIPEKMIYNVTTFAGTGAFGSTNGNRLDATFGNPWDLVMDKRGNMFIADYGNRLIRKIDTAGVVTNFASVTYLTHIAIDGFNNLYVSDGDVLRKISPQGDKSILAGSIYGSGYVDGAGTDAKFNFPRGLAVDDSGYVYVADYGNHRIRKISPAGEVTTLAGNGNGNSTDGVGTNASFNGPRGLSIDADGNLYVSDLYSHLIRKVSPAGTVTTIAGSTIGFKDGAALNAQFKAPNGLVFDKAGNLYITDENNNRVRMLNTLGNVTTIAGEGTRGYGDGLGTAAKFYSANGEMINPLDGDLYVADGGANAIRKINLTGYRISPALPAGLMLDSTGTISGTPTSVSPLTTYSIIAGNAAGADTIAIDLEVTASDVRTWTGAVNTDWNNAGNWNPEEVPAANSDIIIPGALTNYPLLDQSRKIGGLNLGTSAAVVLGDHNLVVTGMVTGADSTNFVHTTGAGKLVRLVPNGSSFTFPVGNSSYNPVTVTNNTGSADSFYVRVLDEVYANGSNGTIVSQARVLRTWDISKATENNTPGVNFVFNWRQNQISAAMASKNLFHYASGMWTKQTGATVVTDTTLSYTSYSGSFSPFAIMEPISGPLPVVWLGISVLQQQSNAVVSWSTAVEFNTKNYTVQHSTDGTNWTSKGVVAAVGHSSSVRHYSFVHTQPVNGSNYYRILQTDNDGSISYSTIVKLLLQNKTGISLYPNPVTSGQVNLQLPVASTVQIFNHIGTLMLQQQLPAGNHVLNVSSFAKGAYVLKQGEVTIPFIIQ